MISDPPLIRTIQFNRTTNSSTLVELELRVSEDIKNLKLGFKVFTLRENFRH